MGLCEVSQTLPYMVSSLSDVAVDVVAHFQSKGFKTDVASTPTGGCLIEIESIEGDLNLGTKAVFKVALEKPAYNRVVARAFIDWDRGQGAATRTSMLAFWPVALLQVWGIVQSNKMDHEAMAVVEQSLRLHGVPMPL